jgi:predicted metal-dependent peptidase
MNRELEKKYTDALEWFSKQKNYLLVKICQLGKIEFSNVSKTACVAFEGNKWKLSFNKNFFDMLNDEEFRFVLAHEAVHVLNGHVSILIDKYNSIKKVIEQDYTSPEAKEFTKFKNKFNIAADCVDNDSLVNLYGFTKPDATSILSKIKIYFGKTTIGADCHDMAVMDVYKLLPDPEPGQGEDCEHGWLMNIPEEFLDALDDLISNNIQNSSLKESELKKLEELQKNLQKSNRAGKGRIGMYRPINDLSSTKMNWDKVIYDFVDIKKTTYQWNKVNNKLISVYPDIILPRLKPKERKEIFVAIDASASIDLHALSLFVGILKNAPRNFQIKCISFDTSVYAYDLKQKENPQGGGGTDFRIIEDYIQENFKKHPYVVVLTDGDGTRINASCPKKWLFLLYGSCNKRYVEEGMLSYKIDDLLR